MICYIMMGIYVSIASACLFVFAWLGYTGVEPIKSRAWRSSIFSAINGAIFVILTAIEVEFASVPEYNNISCHFVVWPTILLIPFYFQPYFSRAFVLWYSNRLHKVLLIGITNKDTSWLIKYRWILKTNIWLCFDVLLAVVSVFITLLVLYFPSKLPQEPFVIANGCQSPFQLVLFGQIVYVLIVLVVLAAILFHSRDVYFFKLELQLISAVALIFFTVLSVQILRPELFPLSIPFVLWLWILIISSLFISIIFPIVLTFHPFYRYSDSAAALSRLRSAGLFEYYTTENLETMSNNVLLEVIMRDVTLLSSFKQFAAESWCIENVLFLSSIRAYENVPDHESRLLEAERIINVFIMASSAMEINLESEVRENICAQVQMRNAPADLFKEAEQRVLLILRNDTLHKWRTTPEFKESIARSSFSHAMEGRGSFSKEPLRRSTNTQHSSSNSITEMSQIDTGHIFTHSTVTMANSTSSLVPLKKMAHSNSSLVTEI